MDDVTLEQIAVPGATLLTERRGSGPLVLFVVGGNGDPAVFSEVARLLSPHLKVVTYARRGFVGSLLDGPVDDATRLSDDVDDAVVLLKHFVDGPAIVFGTSSGAIVTLDLVLHHPQLVHTAILHEPPILDLLGDSDEWAARLGKIFLTYRRDGLWPAMIEFRKVVGLEGPMSPPAGVELPPEKVTMLARAETNMTFWFEHELLQYPAYLVDMDLLARFADKLVLAGGKDSREIQAMPILPISELGRRLHRGVVEFPGGHAGYLEHPVEFAVQLETVIDAHTQKPQR